MIYPIFSEPIYKNKINFLNKKIIDADFKFKKNESNLISENKNVLDSFIDLKDHILIEAMKFLTVYDFTNKYDVEITQSWLNKTLVKQKHPFHSHQNSFLSGVYYLKTKPDDGIVFYKTGNLDFLQYDCSSYNQYNSTNWTFKVFDNDLILFPSKIYHSVEVNETNEERISLSFNIVLRGEFGNKEDLTYLKI